MVAFPTCKVRGPRDRNRSLLHKHSHKLSFRFFWCLLATRICEKRHLFYLFITKYSGYHILSSNLSPTEKLNWELRSPQNILLLRSISAQLLTSSTDPTTNVQKPTAYEWCKEEKEKFHVAAARRSFKPINNDTINLTCSRKCCFPWVLEVSIAREKTTL